MYRIPVLIILIFGFTFLHNVYADVESRQFEVMTGYGIAHLAVEVKNAQ